MIDDTAHAFVPGTSVRLEGAGTGPLAGLAFAAKDCFDVAGHRTGGGNPDWRDAHPPATATAPAIARLVAAGATLVGKTILEELCYGLTGENPHYGTPRNSAAPDHVPGGSSSGSAAAVGAGLVDFALGTDTGGSIRLPASFCGLWGLRSSPSLVPLDGVMPLAPSFDAVGWFARDAAMLARVGRALLPPGAAPRARRLLVAEDALELLSEPLRAALRPAIATAAERLGLDAEPIRLAALPGLDGMRAWGRVMGTIRFREAWESNRAWVEARDPRLGDTVKHRFALGRAIGDEALARAHADRARIVDRLDALLDGGVLLAMPASPCLPPRRGQSTADHDVLRDTNEPINGLAPLGRMPALSAPLTVVDGLPFGLGLTAAAGADALLLAAAEQLGA
ncbi:MAG: amidase [Alphaproteobacteria bacterium]